MDSTGFHDIESHPNFSVAQQQQPVLTSFDGESEEEQLIRKQPHSKTTRKSGSILRSSHRKHKPFPLPDMDIIHRKPKRGVPLPVDPRLMGYAPMMSQSMAGGWAEESDSEDNIDVFEEVRRMKMDPTFQLYLIAGIIVLVLAVVGSVKLHEAIYGKPVIKENTFDFLSDFSKDDEL